MLRQAGVVPGADMTTEAALTKLSYLLGQKLSKEEIKKLMMSNLSGELTVIDSTQHQFSLRDSPFLETIAKALSVSSSQVHYVSYTVILGVDIIPLWMVYVCKLK